MDIGTGWLNGTCGGTAPTHAPQRPHWTCAWCFRPWPCVPAQILLLADHGRVGVAQIMAGHLQTAAHDYFVVNGGVAPDEAVLADYFTRFLGWTRYDAPIRGRAAVPAPRRT